MKERNDISHESIAEDIQSQAGDIRPREEDESAKAERKKKRVIKAIIKTVIWCIIIAIVIFLTFFLSSKIGEFDSIADMIRFIRAQFR